MKLNELKPNAGAKKKKLIVGRGIGSGKGKTCGVGQKGQKARSGVALKGFEGGQMPLYQRLPKFGFNNTRFATKMNEISLSKLLEAIESKRLDAKKEISEDALVAAGLIGRVKDGVKIIGNAAIKEKLNLKVTKISKGAQAIVEKAGGSVELIVREVAPIKNGKLKGSKKA
jgi:large subunit ribosomal protein L15